MLKPVKRQSLSDAVFEQLRDQIVLGNMVPGEILPAERVLAEKFGVNRGALREALKRLEQARLVAIQHGGSTRVLDFRQTAGMDLLTQLLVGPHGFNLPVARSVVEMRSALAPDIARLSAERRRPETASALAAVVKEMEGAKGDLPRLQRLAMDFWSVLVDGSDNLAYRLALNTLRESYLKLADLLTETLKDELSYLAGYRAIAEAVEKQDGIKAEKKTKELVQRGGRRLLELLDAAGELS
ncbi:MAG: GntR family transcriptional regulator [Myxococcota bacterium]